MHRWTRLADTFPRPRALILAGQPVVVGQYTLGDLAQIDDWLSGHDWFSSLTPALLETDPIKRRDLLVRAWKVLEDQPTLGGRDAATVLMTDEGRGLQVLIAAHRASNWMEAKDAHEIGMNATLEEWLVFDRFVWGIPAWKTVIGELDPPVSPMEGDGQDDPHDWGKNVARLVMDYGLPLSEVERLTIGQYRLLCRGGEPDWYRGPEQRAGESVRDWIARSAAIFETSGDPLGEPDKQGEDVDGQEEESSQGEASG